MLVTASDYPKSFPIRSLIGGEDSVLLDEAFQIRHPEACLAADLHVGDAALGDEPADHADTAVEVDRSAFDVEQVHADDLVRRRLATPAHFLDRWYLEH